MEQFDVVIVANGEFPVHPVPLEVLHHAPQLVCCDGAITKLARLSPQTSDLRPQTSDFLPLIIGDGDSVPAEYRDRLIQIDEQEDNDLTKATRYCLRQGWHRIAYLGTTGMREDHTLGNISLLMRYYQEMGVEGMMFTNTGFFTPAQGDRTFASFPRQQVSIFNFGSSSIRSKGLRWESYAYQQWWQGTLNEAVSDSFMLCADSYYLVYQTYEAKSKE